ncbi:alpha/beta hydrolase domain-containing protein [Sphingobium sp. H39-3-25]|uniref:alpha/beta hydrolase domain-containing protein n=1 Tax=Sphingobium arseniciresistens TaxID=3030834 RepID=UPI0023B9DB35|nr:alpha/beta hydrolase domain-containing protein [Sphingobium arseniciresistens]
MALTLVPVGAAAKSAAAPEAATAAAPNAVAKFTRISASAGTPFGSTSINLAEKGYVEEEFYSSGTANRYRMKDPAGTAQIVDGGHPYTTRILVRRPTDPKKFNGRVIVEWYNVSTNADLDMVFGAMRNHLLEDGYAWVGVSAQIQGMNSLRAWNPARYGKLSLAASNDDPLGGQLEPNSPLFRFADVLSWDAFTQVGNALRHPSGVDPLGGLKPTLIIASGESQSAARLTTYYNSILPFARNTFDGFLLYDGVGRALRTDIGTKMVSFRTGPGPADSDVLRVWEVAGASHISYDEIVPYMEEQYQRMGVLRGLDGTPYTLSQTFVGCEITPIYSRVPNGDVLNAALEALVGWVTRGTPPPKADRFRLDDKGRMERGPEGRVTGGIRLAAYDAPMSKSMGWNVGSSMPCGLAGSHQDYTPAQLRQLYGTPANYVARVTAVTRKAEQDGFLLKSDADRTIKDAEAIKF